LIALAVSSASCDQGKVHDEAPAAGPAVHLLGANVVGGLLEPSDRIEVSFDRLLLPLSITRQTFILGELVGDQFLGLTPTIRYDPVARVVTVTPLPEQAFDPEQTYRLTIASPAGPTDVNGLRAIDGATLSATSPSSVTFRVAMDAGTSAPPPAPPPPPDFCTAVLPLFVSRCSGSGCHGGSSTLPAAGLRLTDPQGVLTTAIGQVAEGSNTGPLAGNGQAPTLAFARDMPIIDPGPETLLTMAGSVVDPAAAATPLTGGNPSHSWLTYKLLMAVPPACSTGSPCSDGGLPGADGGVPAGADGGLPGADGGVPAGADGGVTGADGGVPAGADGGVTGADGSAPNPGSLYSVPCDVDGDLCPLSLPDAERARLSALIPGRAMPYPADPGSAAPNPPALTVDELELVSAWMAAGAPVPPACP
jgi:hypothetical protein